MFSTTAFAACGGSSSFSKHPSFCYIAVTTHNIQEEAIISTSTHISRYQYHCWYYQYYTSTTTLSMTMIYVVFVTCYHYQSYVSLLSPAAPPWQLMTQSQERRRGQSVVVVRHDFQDLQQWVLLVGPGLQEPGTQLRILLLGTSLQDLLIVVGSYCSTSLPSSTMRRDYYDVGIGMHIIGNNIGIGIN